MRRSNVRVIILAAGMGTRLRPHTNDRPKCLVEIDGTSLLDGQLEILERASLSNVVLIGGYKSEMLALKADKLVVNQKFDSTNMVHSLFCATEELVGDCLVSYGDIVYSKDILDSLLSSDADISVIVDKNWQSYWESRFANPLDDAETLKLSENNLIEEIGGKPINVDEIQGQYIGLMKFSEKGIQQLKSHYGTLIKRGHCKGKPVENAYMTDLIQDMIDAGYKVKGIPVFSDWIEVDSVEDLESEVTKTRFKNILFN